jgi:hypothetical protein
MGFSQHSGMVIVCDGSAEADRRLLRVLTNDPATGVMRHADAGYDIAIDFHEAELQYPVISTIVAHEKGADLAAAASMFISSLEGFAIGVENLRRYVAGERMLSVVDVAKGY